jgi:hypothetical protein
MRRAVLILVSSVAVIAGCHGKGSGPLYTLHCSEPLPIFKRSSKVPRTPELDAALCKCIWDRLDDANRITAEKMSKNEWNHISSHDGEYFQSHFGSTAVACGP